MLWGGGHLLASLASRNKRILSTPISTPTPALTSTVIFAIKLSLIFIFSFSLGFIVYSELSPVELTEAATVTPGTEYSTAISPSTSTVSLNLDPDDTVKVSSTSINVGTNCPNGYKLFISPKNSDNRIKHTDPNIANTKYLTAAGGTLTSPTSLTSNSWGISLDGNLGTMAGTGSTGTGGTVNAGTGGTGNTGTGGTGNTNTGNTTSATIPASTPFIKINNTPTLIYQTNTNNNTSGSGNPGSGAISPSGSNPTNTPTIIGKGSLEDPSNITLYLGARANNELYTGMYKTTLVYSLVADNSCQSYTLRLNPNHTSRNGSNVTIGSTTTKASNINRLTHRGEAANLSNTNWTRKGYTLDSFNTKADGTGTKYSPNASVVVNEDSIVHTLDDSNGYTSSADILTLYAIWKPIDYTISYTMNSGTTSATRRTTYNVESSAYTIPTATRSGYVFSGWTGTGLTEATMSPTIAKGAIGNKAYTANFRQTQDDTTYPEYCGTGSYTSVCFAIGDIPNDTTGKYAIFVRGTTAALALPTWTTANGQDDIVWYDANTTPSVMFRGCGVGSANDTCETNGAWKRGGKTWQSAVILNKGTTSGTIRTHVYNSADRTLYYVGGAADYTLKHNLTYNANGGSGGKSVAYISGINIAVRRKYDLSYKCTRSGYTQIGYALSSSASAKILSAKTVYLKNVTVYAQWVRTSATIN